MWKECIYWFLLTAKWMNDGWGTKHRQRNCEEDSDARFGNEGGVSKDGIKSVDDQIMAAARCLFWSVLWLGWRKQFFFIELLHVLWTWSINEIPMHTMENMSPKKKKAHMRWAWVKTVRIWFWIMRTWQILNFLNKVEQWTTTGGRKYWQHSLIFFCEDPNFALIFRSCIMTILQHVMHSL